MELKASALQSCINCLNNKHLRSGIYFEDKRGYPNAFVRKMRFNSFLLSKLSKLHSRSKHNYVQNLLEEFDCYDAANISDRPKMLNKVPTLMGCINMEYLIEGEKSLRASDLDPKDTMDEFEISFAYRRFPSIIVGSSSPVELYDETACDCETSSPFASHNCNRYAPNSMGRKWINPDTETWHLLDPCQQLDSSLISKESSSVSPLFCQSIASEKEQKSDSSATMEESCINVPRSRQNTVPVELILDKSVSSIPGLSRRHCNKLEDCGFHTIRKLLHHFPRTYADLQNAQGGIDDGNYLIFVGKILSSRGIRTSYSFSFLEVVVACEIGHGDTVFEPESVDNGTMEKKIIYFHLKKFFRGTRFTNQFFLRSLQEKHKEGDLVCVSGKVRTLNKKDHYEMREYNIDVLDDEKESSARAAGKPYPLYPSKGGLDPNFLRDIISRALQALSEDIDPVPKEMREEFGLPSLYEAYMGIHSPKDLNEADLSRRRLIFDEFFYLQLARLFQMLEGLGTRIEKDGLLNKYKKDDVNTVLIEEWSSITKKFLKALPYSLTPSQLSAVSEIIWDLKRPVPMNRLLQGDVGCGKTVVAFLACMEVIGSGYQAAFMVPTELLAVQHYEHFLELLENMEDERKPLVALLTGSTPSKQSRVIRKGLQTGDISLVIGTHSLISESIEFSALRIAVVDEQHRFGVIQRGTFNNKLYSALTNSSLASANSDASSKSYIYMAPHVLAMSATPIPRSLALALYGDMSLTQITDLPPGRIPVETYTLEGNEIGFENVYQMMKDELLAGGKIYLVYPVIEQSEQLPQLRAASADLKTISSKFPGHCCGLLHGKMKSDEKDEALKRFRSGETHILLSTQVIEIGVDVPDASMMVVMNAERFGIAQLHQLRGRVGRGTRKSRCIFLSSIGSNLNRLKVLEKSSDGFHLANVDLLLRGPGDLLGKKQSGHLPEFPIARLDIDGNILQEAHLVALKILGSSQDLECFPRLKAELSMRQPLCLLGD